MNTVLPPMQNTLGNTYISLSWTDRENVPGSIDWILFEETSLSEKGDEG